MEAAIKDVIQMSWPTLVVLLSIFIIMRVTIYFTGEERHLVIHEELYNFLFLSYLLVLFRLVKSLANSLAKDFVSSSLFEINVSIVKTPLFLTILQ